MFRMLLCSIHASSAFMRVYKEKSVRFLPLFVNKKGGDEVTNKCSSHAWKEKIPFL